MCYRKRNAAKTARCDMNLMSKYEMFLINKACQFRAGILQCDDKPYIFSFDDNHVL